MMVLEAHALPIVISRYWRCQKQTSGCVCYGYFMVLYNVVWSLFFPVRDNSTSWILFLPCQTAYKCGKWTQERGHLPMQDKQPLWTHTHGRDLWASSDSSTASLSSLRGGLCSPPWRGQAPGRRGDTSLGVYCFGTSSSLKWKCPVFGVSSRGTWVKSGGSLRAVVGEGLEEGGLQARGWL